MNRIFPLSSLLLLTTLFVGGCTGYKPGDATSPASNSIVGYWALTKVETMLPPGTPPDEAIEFDAAGNVTEYANGQAQRTGTYQLGTGAAACETNADVVTLTWQPLNAPTKATYTINKGELVIDQGICFDAPRKTYKLTTTSAGKK